MVVETGVSTRLLLDTADGVVELVEDSPGRWRSPKLLLSHPQPGQRYMSGYCLTRDADGETVYVGGRVGVHRSRDGGRAWEAVNRGIGGCEVFTVEAHPSRSGVVFAGMKPAAIFRSEDHGETWVKGDLSRVPQQEKWFYPIAPHTPQVRSFAFDPRDPSWIYAGVEEADLLLSRDGGLTWDPRSTGLTWYSPGPTERPDVHTVVVDPHDPEVVHCTMGNGYFISFNRGERWEVRNHGLHLLYARAVAPDGTRPGRVLVAASELPPRWLHNLDPEASQYGSADAALFETTDYGLHWRQITEGFPERAPNIVGAIVQHPREPERWFASTVGGDLYTSDDGGASWRLLVSGLPRTVDVLAV